MKKVKFSEWIRLAVADVKIVVKSPKYKFDLDQWHSPNSVCRVCFAGARMMGLGAKANDNLIPADFKEEYELEALDELRNGNIRAALGLYHRRIYDKLYILIDEYNFKWSYNSKLRVSELKQFYKDMLHFANELEKLGY